MKTVSIATVVSVILVMLLATASAAAEPDAGSAWQWSVTPYVWASDVTENLSVQDRAVSESRTEFNDLVDKLESSLQVHVEGLGARWGVFADLTYIELTDSSTGEYGITRLDVDLEETLLEAGAILRPGGVKGRLDVLFGSRVLVLDEDYLFTVGALAPRARSIEETYVDALLGIRYHIPLSERWVLSLRGDGSTGDTDFIWTAQGLVGWRFGSKRGSAVLFGYRHRELEYGKGDQLDVEKTLSGFVVGVKIGF